MGSIDYREAFARGWWLLVVLGLVGLGVGILLPSGQPKPQWSTTSYVGANPGSLVATSPLAPGVSTDQILFYANDDSVISGAGTAAHIDAPSWLLRNMIAVSGPATTSSGATTGQPGVVQVKVQAPTIAESVDLNNAFDAALAYQLAGAAIQQIATQEAQVKSSIATTEAQLLAENGGAGASTSQSQLSALQDRLAQLSVTSTDTGFQVLRSSQSYPPTESKAPIADSRPVRALAGLLIGLLLGALVALAVTLLDKRLSTAKRARAAFGYPVVVEIPPEESPSSEKYRMLWLSVFREPLSHPVEQGERLVEGGDLMLDHGTWRGAAR